MRSEGNDTGHLTPDTIREYLRGKLSGRAMHQVESHLLDCEFCADAVEGFELSERSHVKTDQTLLALRKKLNQRIKEHEPRSMIRWPAWSAAAAIALAIAGYVIIKQQEDEQQLLAVRQSMEFLETGVNDTLLIFLPEAPEPVSADKLLAANTRDPRKPRAAAYAPPAEEGRASAARQAPPAEDNTPSAARQAAAATGDSPRTASPAQEERVAAVVPDSQDTIFVIGHGTQRKQAIVGSVSNTKDDTVSLPGVNIAEQNEDEEVVVVGYSGKPKKELQVGATPEGGQAAYEKYLADSLRYPQKALEGKVEGEVVVRFTVRPGGRPAAFKISRSLGHGCDEEAIRLIREGPEWVTPVVKGRPQSARAVQTVIFRLPADGR